jgi:hypothetical protein
MNKDNLLTIPPGVIEAGAVYTLAEVQRRLQLGKAAWRTARREGLPLRVVGRRKYVLGADVMTWIASRPVDSDLAISA